MLLGYLRFPCSEFLSTIALIGIGCDKGLTQLSGSTSSVFESEGTCNYFGSSVQL